MEYSFELTTVEEEANRNELREKITEVYGQNLRKMLFQRSSMYMYKTITSSGAACHFFFYPVLTRDELTQLFEH